MPGKIDKNADSSKNDSKESVKIARESPKKYAKSNDNNEGLSRKNRKRLPAISASDEPEPTEEEPEQQVIEGFCNYQEKEVGVFLEGKCYLKTQSDKFKSHWVKLEGNEIFCFRRKDDAFHRVMHCLSGTFI